MNFGARFTAPNGRPRIGIAEVKASFRAPGREPICLAYVVRPLALLITPAFYNAGFTANQVLVLRAVIGVLALGLLILGGYPASVAALLAYMTAYVLDGVDGNLSRLCDEGNYWGKFIDGLIDSFLAILAPTAAGIGLWLSDGNGLALMIGAIVSVVALFTEAARHRYSFVREWMTAQTGPLTEADQAFLARCDRVGGKAGRTVANLYCFAPWVIVLPEGVWYYLLIMLAFGIGANILWLVTLVRQAYGLFQRVREAVHAGTPVRNSGA